MVLALVVGAVLTGGACGDDSVDAPAPAGQGSDVLTTIVDVDVDAADDGGEVVIDRGRQFGVRFESSASIGDDWVLLSSTDPTVTEIVDERVEVDDPDADGSGGHVVFVVEGMEAGSTALTFVNCFQGACRADDLPDAADIAAQDLETVIVPVTVPGER